jgi:predicted nucleic acid-binding Zn finger protein
MSAGKKRNATYVVEGHFKSFSDVAKQNFKVVCYHANGSFPAIKEDQLESVYSGAMTMKELKEIFEENKVLFVR